jgi:pimeloyl-ACP methyl ester carboxylesterase
MPSEYYCVAVDLRGYGDTQALTIDATRGARDWSDDLYALMQSLGLSSAHWVGWSAGAAAIMQLKIDHADCLKSLTLVAPVSPCGFGGTKNLQGEPCHDDYAGSGGGMVDDTFIRQVKLKNESREHAASPLNVIHESYFYHPQKLPRENSLLQGSLKQQIGSQQYPGDSIASPNWPHSAPGKFGPLNAISAKYYDVSEFVQGQFHPPVLWVRGDKDVIISNRSFSDPAVLGESGFIAAWPGAETYPPQPMIDQMRYLLERYKHHGGQFTELVLPDVGHAPFIEEPDEFLNQFLSFLHSATLRMRA